MYIVKFTSSYKRDYKRMKKEGWIYLFWMR